MITLQLTRAEAVKLEMFLLMTTKFREGELEAHQKFAARKDENGNPTSPAAKSNVEFWTEQCKIMDSIQKRLYHELTSPPAKTEE